MTTTALVVDDEPQILMIIKFALETAGITVETASDGGRAWDKFTKTRLNDSRDLWNFACAKNPCNE